jgi:hypothetical protein
MKDRPNYLDATINKRDVERQRITEYFEYDQTKNDCSRYADI